MSLSAPGSKTTLQTMQQYKKDKDYKPLRKAIADCVDETIAADIFRIVFEPPAILSNCLQAFLTNSHLNIFLEQKALIQIITTIYGKLQKKDLADNKRNAYEQSLVTIASNPSWCRMLSYRYFLDFVEYCPSLLEHIIYDMDFITHLDYFHINLLLSNARDYISVILDYLDEMLQSRTSRDNWALNVLKFIFINNPQVQKSIFENEDYEYTRQLLIKEANENRHFALSVLKTPHLCPALLGVNPNEAYLHPLLTTQDFDELVQHFAKSNPDLALEYIGARIKRLSLKIHDISEKCKKENKEALQSAVAVVPNSTNLENTSQHDTSLSIKLR